jgi:integrase
MARRDPVIIKGEKIGRPGRWLVRYYHTPHERTLKTFRSKEAAEDFRRDVFKNKIGDPNAEADYTVTVGDYAKYTWLPHIKITTKRLSARRYEQALRLHVLPEFKAHKIRDLRPYQIERLLIRKLADGYARPTVAFILATFQSLLKKAKKEKIIPENPAAGLGEDLRLNKPPERNVEKVKAFNEDQLARFFEAAKHASMPYGPLFWIMGLTGLRVGEAIALRWSDLDFANGRVHVQRGLSAGLLSTPKAHQDRFVRLSERGAKVLQHLQMKRADRAKRLKWKTMPEYIFTTRRGTPPNKWSIREEFAKIRERAGLPEHHTPHSLRHTYASLLLNNGESLKFVSEQLGHHSIKVTADVYGKWVLAEPLRGGANYLDAMTRTQTGVTTGYKAAVATTGGAKILAMGSRPIQG